MNSDVRTGFAAVPSLVAHRGWASCYPENTLPAVAAALAAGAAYIEIDIQLTRDLVPVWPRATYLMSWKLRQLKAL